jgi:hypothetical protein
MMASPENVGRCSTLTIAFRDIQIDCSGGSATSCKQSAIGTHLHADGSQVKASSQEVPKLAESRQSSNRISWGQRELNATFSDLPDPPLNTSKIESSPRPSTRTSDEQLAAPFASEMVDEPMREKRSILQGTVPMRPPPAEVERLQSHKEAATSSRGSERSSLAKCIKGYGIHDSLSSQMHVVARGSGSFGSCLDRTVSNEGLDSLQGSYSELGAHLQGKEQLTFLFGEQRRLMNDFFESLDMSQVGQGPSMLIGHLPVDIWNLEQEIVSESLFVWLMNSQELESESLVV